MTEYVAGFILSKDGEIPLVRKKKPLWQAGLLNGIGGKVEAGETPAQAMTREWEEETGTWHSEWTPFAELRFAGSVVHFYKATVDKLNEAIVPFNDIGEAIEIHDYYGVVRSIDMIPNLKWLLPLAFEDADATMVRSVAANDNTYTPPNLHAFRL